MTIESFATAIATALVAASLILPSLVLFRAGRVLLRIEWLSGPRHLARNQRCIGCGYDLAGLNHCTVCPECGLDPKQITRLDQIPLGHLEEHAKTVLVATFLPLCILWLPCSCLIGSSGWHRTYSNEVSIAISTLPMQIAIYVAMVWLIANVRSRLGKDVILRAGLKRRIWTGMTAGVLPAALPVAMLIEAYTRLQYPLDATVHWRFLAFYTGAAGLMCGVSCALWLGLGRIQASPLNDA